MTDLTESESQVYLTHMNITDGFEIHYIKRKVDICTNVGTNKRLFILTSVRKMKPNRADLTGDVGTNNYCLIKNHVGSKYVFFFET